MSLVTRLSKPKLAAIWILIWIPLSFLFPSDPHFPIGGVFAPIIALVFVLRGEFLGESLEFDWGHVYLPALVFWLGGVAFVVAASKWTARKQETPPAINEGNEP